MHPPLPDRAFGASGLVVSALGLGAGRLGGDDLDDAGAFAVLGAALDAGVTLVDTATSAKGKGTVSGTVSGSAVHFTVTIPAGGFDAPYASCAATSCTSSTSVACRCRVAPSDG